MRSHFYKPAFILLTAFVLFFTCEEPEEEEPVDYYVEYKAFGDNGIEEGHSVVQTSDGGYIITGGNYSLDTRNKDVFVVKTDVFGDTIWTRTYGGDQSDEGNSVQQMSDGDYIIAGRTQSYGNSSEAILIRIDANGGESWTNTLGGPSSDAGIAAIQSRDGGIIVAGYTHSFGAGHNDVWLVKTDRDGGLVWQKTYGGAGYELSYDVKQTTDGGYILVGRTGPYAAAGVRAWLIKTDATGDTLWTRTYGDSLDMRGEAVYPTNDGGYVFAGKVGTFNRGRTDVLVIKTDATGDTQWTVTYGGRFPDWAEDVRQTIDGGYVVVGYSPGIEEWDCIGTILILKLNSSGSVVWDKRIPGNVGRSVIQTSDGGFAVTGGIGDSNYHSDMLLIKTDQYGNVVPFD